MFNIRTLLNNCLNMKRILLVLLLPLFIFATEFSYDEAVSYIKKDLHKVTSLSFDCVAFYHDGPNYNNEYISYSFDLREIHNEKCGGDPDISPLITNMSISKNTVSMNISSSVRHFFCGYVGLDEYEISMECPKKKYCIYPSDNPDYPTIAAVYRDVNKKCPEIDEDGGALIRSYIE